jgi:hypothetical protein
MRSSRRADERSELPLTLPVGPWASWDGAQAALDSWCKDSTTGGGGWGTSTRDFKASNSVRGAQRVLACHFHSLTKGNCKWRLTLEDTTEGWAIHSVNSAHNHALVQSLAEANSHAGMRNIPDELKSSSSSAAAAAVARTATMTSRPRCRPLARRRWARCCRRRSHCCRLARRHLLLARMPTARRWRRAAVAAAA